jgi:hypothetical protein
VHFRKHIFLFDEFQPLKKPVGKYCLNMFFEQTMFGNANRPNTSKYNLVISIGFQELTFKKLPTTIVGTMGRQKQLQRTT